MSQRALEHHLKANHIFFPKKNFFLKKLCLQWSQGLNLERKQVRDGCWVCANGTQARGASGFPLVKGWSGCCFSERLVEGRKVLVDGRKVRKERGFYELAFAAWQATSKLSGWKRHFLYLRFWAQLDGSSTHLTWDHSSDCFHLAAPMEWVWLKWSSSPFSLSN